LNTDFRVDLTRFKVQTNFTWIWVFELWIDLNWNFLEKNKSFYSPWAKTGWPKTQLGWWPTVRTESGEQSLSHGDSVATRAGGGSDPRVGPVVVNPFEAKEGQGLTTGAAPRQQVAERRTTPVRASGGDCWCWRSGRWGVGWRSCNA
jgi:hypothetical protein